ERGRRQVSWGGETLQDEPGPGVKSRPHDQFLVSRLALSAARQHDVERRPQAAAEGGAELNHVNLVLTLTERRIAREVELREQLARCRIRNHDVNMRRGSAVMARHHCVELVTPALEMVHVAPIGHQAWSVGCKRGSACLGSTGSSSTTTAAVSTSPACTGLRG